ncbi:MAG: hypothetical protein OQK56_06995, partial [Ignavibacteriaceae bacterium]|nr:hypothetical protein [Ignavibacteriaceae bacterium]
MKKDKMKSVKDFTKADGQIVNLNAEDFINLPHPYEDWVDPPFRELTEDQKNRMESSLDGFSSLAMPKPQTDEEKEKLVAKFLSGLQKLLSKEDNWIL